MFIVTGDRGLEKWQSFDAKRFEVFAEIMVFARCNEINGGVVGENAFNFGRLQRGFQRERKFIYLEFF
jgi:hypothetical protein